MANNIIVKEITEESFTSSESLNNLIRVLSRISTIPKLDNINIFSSKKYSDRFKIVPGTSIILGENYLENPVLAILYLRYGFEWQLWYENYGKDKKLANVYDLAAYKVTKYFYELLSLSDRSSLNSQEFLLVKLFSRNFVNESLNRNNSLALGEKLKQFHDLESKNSVVSEINLRLLNSLAKPCEYLMMEGGDDRLKVSDKNLLNKYGCTPFPRPQALTFASSTATSISNYAFDKADKLRGKLIEHSFNSNFSTCIANYGQELKTDLRKAINLKKKYEVVFSPSGTDSALQLAALMQIYSKKEITHILIGADETGSGVPTALKGCHFQSSTALNHEVIKDELIHGFRPVELEQISLRDNTGGLKSFTELDREVEEKVQFANSNNRFVVLHTIDQSKLGYSAPSNEIINYINNLYGSNIQINVDASQFRLDSNDINNYLENNYIVTITGSKFFTGPPYSGALLIPNNLNDNFRVNNNKLPIGLNKYFNKSDWPIEWVCSNLLPEGFNLGTLIRWKAATTEMQRYFKTPLLYRNLGIEMFCNYVHQSILESENLEPLYLDFTPYEDTKKIGLRMTRTIFPFFLKYNKELLDTDKVNTIYNLLNSDLSDKLISGNLDSLRLAATKCHIGQGVQVMHSSGLKTSVLRISLGSRVISESWKERDVSLFFRNIQEQMSQISIIIKKMELIINSPKLYCN